jgi:hypothetical protein
MTTNPNNIKLETPVSFCHDWFSFHFPIHVGQHSEWQWAGISATDLSLLQNIQNSHIAHTFCHSIGTTGPIPDVCAAQVPPLTSICYVVNRWTYTATEKRAA